MQSVSSLIPLSSRHSKAQDRKYQTSSNTNRPTHNNTVSCAPQKSEKEKGPQIHHLQLSRDPQEEEVSGRNSHSGCEREGQIVPDKQSQGTPNEGKRTNIRATQVLYHSSIAAQHSTTTPHPFTQFTREKAPHRTAPQRTRSSQSASQPMAPTHPRAVPPKPVHRSARCLELNRVNASLMQAHTIQVQSAQHSRFEKRASKRASKRQDEWPDSSLICGCNHKEQVYPQYNPSF